MEEQELAMTISVSVLCIAAIMEENRSLLNLCIAFMVLFRLSQMSSEIQNS